jgi:predicted dehydrogenase
MADGSMRLYNSDKDTFDHGMTLIKFRNGAIATHTCNVVASFNNRTLRISGTEGCLAGDLNKRQLTWYQRNTRKTKEFELLSPAGDMHGGGDLDILRSFANFARGRKVTMVRPAEAAVSVRIGLAANRSSDTGRVVIFPEILHKC